MMFCTVSLPTKWSMREIWSSCSVRRVRAVRAHADSALRPNGFPIATRRQKPGLPSCAGTSAKPTLAEPVHDRPEEAVGNREIEDYVARRAVFLHDCVEMSPEAAVEAGIVD